ncbi:MAG: sigma-54-dependent Fis family transcriptional regulator [Planctomycetes bacterium]|nr:sigma-54-dependent Fis family transcriptional regulator [Planctomycetota bacterium]
MIPKPRILVVEDQQAERDAMARLLRMERHQVVTARDPEEALSHVDEPVGLVITDLRMGHATGVDLLRAWHKTWPDTPFIILTGYGDINSAVAAIKLGAHDYLTKPVDPDELLKLVERALESRQSGPMQRDDETCEPVQGFEGLVGRSPQMLAVFDRVRRAAQTDSLVLIQGESGTGKELIAEAIHRNSRRCHEPFLAVNMAAIPYNLVESELFGHVRGSFTGAMAARIGRFEGADGGTLFIDEIGEFELSAQAKLLRVLETFTITPVGSNEDRRVDVRIVAATSRDLERLLASGAFREDLYYRLNVVTIHLPPLRERRSDIPLLVDYFLAKACAVTKKPKLGVTDELEEFLEEFDWPGNVRQLRNAVESMVVLARGSVLTMHDLPQHLAPPARPAVILPAQDGTLHDLERVAVMQALERASGNRTRAAETLGISVRTLQRRLKSWQLC